MAGPADLKANVEKSLGALSYVAYLLHPSQPSFDDYTGNYPEGLRDSMGGLIELAQMLGFESDSINDKINDIVDELTPVKIVDILDGLSEAQFTKIYENKAIKEIIDSVAAPFIAQEVEGMSIGKALERSDSTVDLSAFEVDGQKLTDVLIKDLNEEALKQYVSALDGKDEATLGFLNSLSDEQKADVLKQLAYERDADGKVVLDSDGKPVSLKDANGEVVSFEGMGIEEAIEARAKIGLEDRINGSNQLTQAWMNAWGGVDSEDYMNEAKAIVYDNIRAALPANIMATVEAQKTAAPNITAAELYKTLREKLDNEDGRKKILDTVTANMESIQKGLKENTDIAFMTQFFPEMVNAKISEGIREFLQDNAFLGPIVGIMQQLFQFVGNALRGFGFDGVADKLEGAMDITKMQKDGNSLEFDNAATGAKTDTTGQPDPTDDTQAVPAPGPR